MKYIVMLDVENEADTLKEIKKHATILAKLPSMEEGRTILVETNCPDKVRNLSGVRNFGENRTTY